MIFIVKNTLERLSEVPLALVQVVIETEKKNFIADLRKYVLRCHV
jgi:hypothetical protein